MDVTDKVAIVTGGGRGIGRGISLELARSGADVVVADINQESAQAVADEVVAAGHESQASFVDVTDRISVERMVSGALGRFGRIDILVNNAGTIGAPGWERRPALTDEDWDVLYEVNVKGTATVTNEVASHMKQRRYGKIINIASGAGREGNPRHPPYGVSKAGVISLTQAAALELAPYDINVNAICPELIWTPMWERISYRGTSTLENVEGLTSRELFDLRVRQSIPLGREQEPEDIGHLAAFLASDYARNITGQAINVNGGSRMN